MISKKIIITGVGGMIGSYLANYFLKKKYRVYGIWYSLSRWEQDKFL